MVFPASFSASHCFIHFYSNLNVNTDGLIIVTHLGYGIIQYTQSLCLTFVVWFLLVSMLFTTAAVLMMGKSFHRDYIFWLECVCSSHKKQQKKNISSFILASGKVLKETAVGQRVENCTVEKLFTLLVSTDFDLFTTCTILRAFSCFVNLSCCRFARFASLLGSCSLDLNFSSWFLNFACLKKS